MSSPEPIVFTVSRRLERIFFISAGLIVGLAFGWGLCARLNPAKSAVPVVTGRNPGASSVPAPAIPPGELNPNPSRKESGAGVALTSSLPPAPAMVVRETPVKHESEVPEPPPVVEFHPRFGAFLVLKSEKGTFLGQGKLKSFTEVLVTLEVEGGGQIEFDRIHLDLESRAKIWAVDHVAYAQVSKTESATVVAGSTPAGSPASSAVAAPPPSSTPASEGYSSSSSSGGTVTVRGYYRKDGTYVHGYTRRR